MISWELGAGQYWQSKYDPNDPFTINDSHSKIPDKWKVLISDGEITPILIVQGTLYPYGRMQSILIKGVDPAQTILTLPTAALKNGNEEIKAIIGSAMAGNTRLKKGDAVTLRWRDKNGAFDAAEVIIAHIFKPIFLLWMAVRIWIPIEQLRKMMLLPDEATLLVKRNGNGKKFRILKAGSFRVAENSAGRYR